MKFSNYPPSPASSPDSGPSSESPKVLSVASLNAMARALLEDCFPAVLVEGEISNLAVPASGHWYLTLKDEAAQVRCAMFRGRNSRVRFRPANGMKVLVRGRLSIYEGRGDYQLILDSMQEAGAGALQRAFEQLKARLSAEGLFDPAVKKPLPEHTRHVAVITSATGAALQDILSIFARRFPAIEITVLPVPVQGSEAPAAIVQALQTANRRAAELAFDVIILGRGGGSLEDLQAFNEESVARAIHASRLPVVSAVGHETDFSIADFVADARAATPSAAAELLSPDQREYMQIYQAYEQRFYKLIRQKLNQQQQQLHWHSQRLKHPGRRLQEHAQTLDILEGRLQRALRNRLNAAEYTVQRLNAKLHLHSPRTALQQYRQQQHNLAQRLLQAVRQQLRQRQTQLQELSRCLDNVSPLQTLSRGYSITADSRGNVLRSSTEVLPGETLVTTLSDGKLISVVTESPKEN